MWLKRELWGTVGNSVGEYRKHGFCTGLVAIKEYISESLNLWNDAFIEII